MSETKKKKDMYVVHFIIMALIPVVMGMLPAPAPITPYGPGMGEPGGLPSMGLHRVGHD